MKTIPLIAIVSALLVVSFLLYICITSYNRLYAINFQSTNAITLDQPELSRPSDNNNPIVVHYTCWPMYQAKVAFPIKTVERSAESKTKTEYVSPKTAINLLFPHEEVATKVYEVATQIKRPPTAEETDEHSKP